jgi:hypothetical protein
MYSGPNEMHKRVTWTLRECVCKCCASQKHFNCQTDPKYQYNNLEMLIRNLLRFLNYLDQLSLEYFNDSFWLP